MNDLLALTQADVGVALAPSRSFRQMAARFHIAMDAMGSSGLTACLHRAAAAKQKGSPLLFIARDWREIEQSLLKDCMASGLNR